MVPKNIIAAQVVKSITASVSCFASSFLCFTIWSSPNGLSSPYSRIIFGLSIADILQSIGFLFGQVLSPADTPDAIFSRGTVASCEAIGYIFIVGLCAILWYTLFLTYYFLKRVKYKKTPKEFAKKEEYYITLFIWMYAVTFASVALKAEEINATSYGATCYLKPLPRECATDESVECVRGDKAIVLESIGAGVLIFVFVSLLFVLISFTCHVYNVEKHLEGNELTKRAMHQSMLYILAFMLVYAGPIIMMFLNLFGNDRSTAKFWLVSVFYPIGGFLNMLIYTRPKVQALKEVEPQLPVFICFLCVILAGGEVPSSLVDYNPNAPHRSVSQSRIPQTAQRLGWPTHSADLHQALDDYIKALFERGNEEEKEDIAPDSNSKDSSRQVAFEENDAEACTIDNV
ncbi:hypothetical protein CTEN210_12758 [Chaetoceros tenuissimus]|uniref:G-protein coupled receptors family 1 profile domain-containing protein n=1 Tax=Chaetoceros tenuissimus TaxID=426638 RepID=A0AAD3HA64_9STRA|nr:hypothetical protein CTEN210_12758 [Chaetoceros tenuissimus]